MGKGVSEPATVSRRQFLRAMSAAAAAAFAAPLPDLLAQTPSRPNIILILSDDHSNRSTPSQLSRFGIPEVTNLLTNLTRLQNGGMRFDNCFSSNSLCAPARATLFSGQYAHMHGITGNNINSYRSTPDSLPRMLKNAGYQTAVFGKWHLGVTATGGENPQGFDRWKIRNDSSSGLSSWEQYYDMPIRQNTGATGTQPGYFNSVMADDSVNWIKGRDKLKPFFLMYNPVAPHEAWIPESQYATLFASTTFPQPQTFNDNYATRGTAIQTCDSELDERLLNNRWPTFVTRWGKPAVPASLTTQQKKEWLYQQLIKDYLRVLKSMDDSIGKLLDCVESEGIKNDTIVMYTSDNGAFIGEHGFYDKRLMYEESMHIPLYIQYPALVGAGTINYSLLSDVDFAPTLLDLAGIAVPPSMQGRSFKGFLQGTPPADWRTGLYYHYWDNYTVHYIARHEGIRTDCYKLIHYYRINTVGDIDEWELFDLWNDPNELNNLVNDATYETVFKNLKADLARMTRTYQVPEPPVPSTSTGLAWQVYPMD